jgi:pimeloyl-ACP methyl ester carboxylesterase
MKITRVLCLAGSIACVVNDLTGQERRMQRVDVGAVELEYEIQGVGDPVVLVHAGVFGDWFEPLMTQPALAGRFRLVRYHRIGYAGSSRATTHPSIRDQALQLQTLLRQLGVTRAHLVGPSSGGNVAIELAMLAPEMVASLVLLEPAIPVAPRSDARLLSTSSRGNLAMDRFRAGDKAGAVDAFMQLVAGPDYRASLDSVLPNAFAHAVRDADTFFMQELPAIQQWTFAPDFRKRLMQPVLAVIGEGSRDVAPIWPQRQQLLLDSLPNVEGFELRGATHLLHVQQPRLMAEALAQFLQRHRIR